MAFIKYNDSATIYNDSGQAFAHPDDFFAAGGAKDFSNVQQLNQATPDILKNAPLYSKNTTIPAANIAPQANLNLPPKTQTQDNTALNPSNVTAGSAQTVKSITDYLKDLTPPETATSKQYDEVLDRINTLIPQLGNKQQDQASAEAAAGIADLQKQLAQLNGEIQTKSAAYTQAYQALENNPQQLAAVVGSKQQQLQRTQAVDLQMTTAKALAVQGNLEAARSAVNRAIDLKYGGLEQELSLRAQQLQLIAPILSKEEERYAQAAMLKIQDDQRRLQEQKENELLSKQFALENNIQAPFYQIGGTIYRTSDGKPYSTAEAFFADGGAMDFSGVQVIDAARSAEQNLVVQYATQYPDAGITLKDSIGTAQQKILKSKIYQDQVRGPVTTISPTTQLALNQNKILSQASQALEKERASSKDGFANPDTYRKFKDQFLAAGGTVSDFITSLPLTSYIAEPNRKGDLTTATTPGNTKPPTETEKATANYAARLSQANQILSKVEQDIIKQGAFNQKTQALLPNALKSSNTQEFEQAKRNFITAVLRKESGAAISQSEFDEANKLYFPQPGDSPQTIANKQATRASVLQSFVNASGMIRVKEKSSGRTGNIPANEFDPNLYERI